MATSDVEFDFSQLVQLGKELEASLKQLKGDAFKLLLHESEELRRKMKEDMPVDTGAARDSWGSVPAGAVAAKRLLEGVWREDKDGLEIEQGSVRDAYNYIIRLNQGSSQQAPAGFIDDNFEKAQDSTDEAIQELLNNLL